jgi:hypothetical protein
MTMFLVGFLMLLALTGFTARMALQVRVRQVAGLAEVVTGIVDGFSALGGIDFGAERRWAWARERLGGVHRGADGV